MTLNSSNCTTFNASAVPSGGAVAFASQVLYTTVPADTTTLVDTGNLDRFEVLARLLTNARTNVSESSATAYSLYETEMNPNFALFHTNFTEQGSTALDGYKKSLLDKASYGYTHFEKGDQRIKN